MKKRILVKPTKRQYSTRTLVRVYQEHPHKYTDFTVPSMSQQYLMTIPDMKPGTQYQFFKQTVCLIDGETLTSRPFETSKLTKYKGPHTTT